MPLSRFTMPCAALLAALSIEQLRADSVIQVPTQLDTLPLTSTQIAKIDQLIAPIPNRVETYEHKAGGASTVQFTGTREAFSQHSANLDYSEQSAFKVGNGIFKKLWVAAPASTQASDGLGPLYNARSCQHCHLKDGRSAPPQPGSWVTSSILLKLSQASGSGDPVYGRQLQTLSIPGTQPEAKVTIKLQTREIDFADGSRKTLTSHQYEFTELASGAFHQDTAIGGRVAPAMIGLGLLEAIPESRIATLADPDDKDADGISGRINWVSSTALNQPMIGRFGWKAGQPTIRDQVTAAFLNDLGLSTEDRPYGSGDCTALQPDCLALPVGSGNRNGPEVSADMVDWVTFYSRNLAVPERTEVNSVLPGKAVFHQIGCQKCHIPSHVTGKLNEPDEQSLNLIYPYTDLLLHDMGPDLSDGTIDGSANGSEWRTAPLWGIGRLPLVNGHQKLLHDGRANGVEEAILWHGGEALKSTEAYKQLEKTNRDALVEFVNSL